MKIGIYGGTFNPPHLGHLAAARAAIDALGLDKLLIVPDAVPPHKALPEGTPAAEHRLAMAEKLADALLLPKVAQASDLELTREGKSYTADTVAAVRAQEPDAELWLLMGTDMFLTLHRWYHPEEILKQAGDVYKRQILSRVIYGSRISPQVGLISAESAARAGVVLRLLAEIKTMLAEGKMQREVAEHDSFKDKRVVKNYSGRNVPNRRKREAPLTRRLST